MEATERTPNYPSAIEAVPMNVNVSSLNDDEDFFAFAFGGGEPSSSPSSAAATYLLGSTWLLVQLLGTPLLLGKLHFEVYGGASPLHYHNQTVVGKLYVYAHWLGLVYNLTGFNVLCARAVAGGPVPGWLCAFQAIEMKTFAAASCIILVLRTGLRYMYTCVWRHLGALDDDFFGLYFMLASILLAAFYSVLLIITGDYDGLISSICKGSDPTMLNRPVLFGTGIPPTSFLIMASGLFCLATTACITVRTYRSSGQQVHPAGAAGAGAGGAAQQMFDMFGANWKYDFCLLIIIVVSNIPNLWLRSLYRSQLPPPAVVPPVLVGLAVVSEHLAVLVALPVSFYLHDGRLRRHAKRTLRDLLPAMGCGLLLGPGGGNAVAPA